MQNLRALMAYRINARLRDSDALSKFAIVKTLQNLPWDIRATNADRKRELEPSQGGTPDD